MDNDPTKVSEAKAKLVQLVSQYGIKVLVQAWKELREKQTRLENIKQQLADLNRQKAELEE